MGVVQLIFLLIALLMVITAFFPNWAFGGGPVVAPNRIIGLLIGLVVLFVVYLVVVALFGGGPVLRGEGLVPMALPRGAYWE